MRFHLVKKVSSSMFTPRRWAVNHASGTRKCQNAARHAPLMAEFERKSAIDVHAGLQPAAGWPFDTGSRSGRLQLRFRIPSAVHRSAVLVNNRLPPCPVKTLSLGLRCDTERKASTSSGWAGTTRNRPPFPLRTVTNGWAPART